MWRNYIALWLVSVITLILFLTLSFCESERLAGGTLKKATFADVLLKEPAAELPTTQLKALTHSDATDTVATDTASQRILIIGDSMLEGLNPRLAAYAKANGHTLNSVIWYSSTSEYWGSCDTLGVFLRRFNPTYIFISLGGNELFVRDIAAKRDKYVKSLLRQIGDIPYVWIGPPNWKPDTGINDLIAANVPQGQFFLSNGMHFDRAKDGAHPTHASAALWLDSVARWMPRHCSHPIKMVKPADGIKARPASVTVLQPKH